MKLQKKLISKVGHLKFKFTLDRSALTLSLLLGLFLNLSSYSSKYWTEDHERYVDIFKCPVYIVLGVTCIISISFEIKIPRLFLSVFGVSCFSFRVESLILR